MDSTTQNVPDVIRQEAKQRALKIIQDNPKCISYVRPEDLETADFFFPVVSVIQPTKADFYPSIPKIGIMAKPQLVNLIAEKSGVEILRTETSKRGQYIWVAHSFGRKRLPDGTMRPEDAGYEWDAELRAKMDFLTSPDKYKTDAQKEYHILEYAKIGESRSYTGAQHALIHKLAHVARSFANEQELMQGMLVVRVDRNNAAIIAATQDPQMKLAVLNQAVGATETVYGPPKQIEGSTPRTVNVESGETIQQPPAGDLFAEEEPPAQPAAELTEEQKLKEILKEYKEKIPADALTDAKRPIRDAVQALIDNPEATVDRLNAMIDRLTAWLQSHGKAGAA